MRSASYGFVSIINMGRSYAMLCICFFSGCLAATHFLDPDYKFVVRLLDIHDGLPIAVSSLTDTFPSTEWSLGFWVKRSNYNYGRIVTITNPLMSLDWWDTTIELALDTSTITTVTQENNLNWWVYCLVGSTSGVAYFSVSILRGNQYYNSGTESFEITSSTIITFNPNPGGVSTDVMIK